MRGDIDLITKLLCESKDFPIQASSKEEALRIMTVINTEYWKEFKRKLEYSENSRIIVKGLGTWDVYYSKLKGYIRKMVDKIRYFRKRLTLLKSNPNFDEQKSKTYLILQDMLVKLRAALKQLDEQKELYILRYLKYTAKKRKLDPGFKPNYDYTWFPYSFKNKLCNNSSIDMKLIS